MADSPPPPEKIWQTIPATLWHVISFAIFLLTITVAYAAFRSASVDLEVFNLRLQLTQAVEETSDISSELQRQSRQLEAGREELRQGVEEWERVAGNSAVAQEVISSLAPITNPDSAAVDPVRIERLNENIYNLREQIRAPIRPAPLPGAIPDRRRIER